ncbi:hypothetical protein [Demequina sp.]|uniref:hypothetical protein n=1 Tax=Demequina sp. TaxID=2050685 RepID=UPI003D124694
MIRVVVGSCVAIVALTACSSAVPEPSASPTGSEFALLATDALNDARANGASDAQLHIIEDAIATGGISFDAIQEAVHATFACFDSAGVRYEEFAPAVTNGTLFPSYSFEGEEKTAVADECIHTNSDYVEMLYMRQPSAIEAGLDAFEAGMPVLIACLRRLGYELDDDVTADELKALLVMREEDVGTPREQEALDRFACVREAGIEGW